MKSLAIFFFLLFAGISGYAQDPCACELPDAFYRTTFILDTCGTGINATACEDKASLEIYPEPSVESFYARVKSRVGWSVRTSDTSDWFSVGVRTDSAGVVETTHELNQISAQFAGVRDSLASMFSHLGVQGQIKLVRGPTHNIPIMVFHYEVVTDQRVNALEMLKLLVAWAPTMGYRAEHSRDLNFGVLTGVELDPNELDVRVVVAGNELEVTNSLLTAQSVHIYSVVGTNVLTRNLEPGNHVVDIEFLPVGVYVVVVGNKIVTMNKAVVR